MFIKLNINTAHNQQESEEKKKSCRQVSEEDMVMIGLIEGKNIGIVTKGLVCRASKLETRGKHIRTKERQRFIDRSSDEFKSRRARKRI